jgi:hypothetical protein
MQPLNQFWSFSNRLHVAVNYGVKHTMPSMRMHDVGVCSIGMGGVDVHTVGVHGIDVTDMGVQKTYHFVNGMFNIDV